MPKKWHHLKFNSQNFDGKYVKCPSPYQGYRFSHPFKLIKMHDWWFEIVFHDEWEFELFTKTSRVRLTAQEVIELFYNPDLEADTNVTHETFVDVQEPKKLEGEPNVYDD